MELRIGIRWLLERQAEVLSKHPAVHDFSALVAAVARHRVSTPRIDAFARDIEAGRADGYDAAARIRAWRL